MSLGSHREEKNDSFLHFVFVDMPPKHGMAEHLMEQAFKHVLHLSIGFYFAIVNMKVGLDFLFHVVEVGGTELHEGDHDDFCYGFAAGFICCCTVKQLMLSVATYYLSADGCYLKNPRHACREACGSPRVSKTSRGFSTFL